MLQNQELETELVCLTTYNQLSASVTKQLICFRLIFCLLYLNHYKWLSFCLNILFVRYFALGISETDYKVHIKMRKLNLPLGAHTV